MVSTKVLLSAFKGGCTVLSSLNVSYRLKGKNEKIDYHSHPEYEIYFFHAETCKYLIHNQIYDLKPGDIIVMDGLTLHRPNISSNEPYIRSVIHFSPHIIRNVLKTLNSEYLLDIFEQLPHYFIRTKENRLAKKLEEEIGRASCRERKKRSDVNRTRKKQ